MKRALELTRILGTFVFVGLTIWLLDARAMLAVLQRIEIEHFAVACVISGIVMILTGVKWRIMLPNVGLGDIIRLVFIGQFYSFFFFGQASGEAAKIYLLSKNVGSVSGAAASNVADRLTSLVALLTVSLVGFASSSTDSPRSLQWTVVAVLSVCVVLLLSLRLEAAAKIALWIATWMEGSGRSLRYAAQALRNAIMQWHASVHDIRRISASLLLGVLIHLGNAAALTILAEGVRVSLSFADWCWIVGIMSVAGLIPLSIGQVTANGTLVGLLHIVGTPLNDAMTVSILSLFINFLIAVAGALLEWLRARKLEALKAAANA
ncbi:hypothetical protein GWG65_19965 [Bradyrhizobium sp. CSA207]|uniref:lysylphosphatidylglycerol synthase transmembrane domain-containing protein n=1 Tax=Bradyrhizobium sp. CSA207 TaxID=2698826 RepID=UPI0023AEAF62|nr:lysylphosphatidylglycerol synthase transmembrane domain-containing protein [Bradyrhizobium sp. CSA207]MDE5443680.1 hypothetical protein [Bradyrhizobium sp. CSA207]